MSLKYSKFFLIQSNLKTIKLIEKNEKKKKKKNSVVLVTLGIGET